MITIVGFSISGLLSAYKLRDIGEVKVFDRPSPIICSGLLSKNGFNKVVKDLRLNKRKYILNKIKGAIIHFPNGKTIEVVKNKPVAYVIDRVGLERDAKENIKEDIKIEKRAATEKDILSSPIVIGADGINSIVAKTYGMGNIKRIIKAGIWYTNGGDDDIVHIYIGKPFTGFFGWMIPRGENREIGFGVESHKDITKAISFMKNIYGDGEIKMKGIPIRERKRISIESEGIYLVGNSAGQVKSSTGGGMYYTAIATDILMSSLEKGTSYQTMWRKKIGKEMKLHKAIQRAFRLPDKMLNSIYHIISRIGIDEYLKRYGDMDFPSAFISPKILGHVIIQSMDK